MAALVDIRSHGFEFAVAPGALKNPNELPTVSIYDGGIRRYTSRFVYKFVEPAD